MHVDGKILSIEDYKKIGYSFKADGSVEAMPKAMPPAVAPVEPQNPEV